MGLSGPCSRFPRGSSRDHSLHPAGDRAPIEVRLVQLHLVGEANMYAGLAREIVEVDEQQPGALAVEEVGARVGIDVGRVEAGPEVRDQRAHQLPQQLAPRAEVIVEIADRHAGACGDPRDGSLVEAGTRWPRLVPRQECGRVSRAISRSSRVGGRVGALQGGVVDHD